MMKNTAKLYGILKDRANPAWINNKLGKK